MCVCVRSLCGRRPADVCSAVSLISDTSLQPESVPDHGENPSGHTQSVSQTHKHAPPLLPSEKQDEGHMKRRKEPVEFYRPCFSLIMHVCVCAT